MAGVVSKARAITVQLATVNRAERIKAQRQAILVFASEISAGGHFQEDSIAHTRLGTLNCAPLTKHYSSSSMQAMPQSKLLLQNHLQKVARVNANSKPEMGSVAVKNMLERPAPRRNVPIWRVQMAETVHATATQVAKVVMLNLA